MSIPMNHEAIIAFQDQFEQEGEKLLKWVSQNPLRKLYVFSLEPKEKSKNNQIEFINLRDDGEKKLYDLSKRLAFAKATYICGSMDNPVIDRLKNYKEGVEHEISEVSDCAYDIVANVIKNSKKAEKVSSYKTLKGLFLGENAVLCGFGPTLKKSLPFLKKVKGKSLILASASAAAYLVKEGIEPDAIALIDKAVPKELVGKKLEEETPIFSTFGSNICLLSRLKGHKAFISSRYAFPIESFVYQECFHENLFPEKFWTVSDFMVEVALHLGCRALFLVGVDLVIEKGKKYADGTSFKAQDEYYTPRDWQFSAESIQQKKETAWIGRINPSSFKLDVPSFSNEEAFESFFKEKSDKNFNLKLISKMAENPAQISYQVLNLLKDSFQRVKKLTEVMIQNVYSEDKITPFFLISESELELELYTDVVLNPLWERWEKIMPENSLEYALKKILFFDTVIKKHSILW